MKTFAERKAALDRLGWKYHVETEYRGEVPRKPHDLEIFKSVRLPLTPRDWCRYKLSKDQDSRAYEEARMAWNEAAEYFGQNGE